MILLIKKFLILLILTMLTNCMAPGSALLSPVITGAKTKSVHQASLSLASSVSSNQLIKIHGEKIKSELVKKSKEIFDYLNHFHDKKKLI